MCAENIALALVRLNIPSGFRYKQNSLNVQMKEYCDTKIAWPEELQCSSEPNPYNVLAEEVRAMDMSTKSSTPHGFQDVGQEYQAYIDGELLNKKQDPLKFWEVWMCFGGFDVTSLTVCIHNPGKLDTIPNSICHRNGLSPYPSIIHAM